jgi:hypothetical protein
VATKPSDLAVADVGQDMSLSVAGSSGSNKPSSQNFRRPFSVIATGVVPSQSQSTDQRRIEIINGVVVPSFRPWCPNYYYP